MLEADGLGLAAFVFSDLPFASTRRGDAGVPPWAKIGCAALAVLLQRKGLSACIAEVAGRIERYVLRWNHFDKSARVACHSDKGVIELMPIADASEFAFKYVNGHRRNTHDGLPTVMAFGVLADVAVAAQRLAARTAGPWL